MFEATLKNRISAHFAPVTITFPIPEDQYEQAILALKKSQIGDARVQDCLIDNSVAKTHQAAPKKMTLRKAQKFQLFRPIGTQCVMGVQSVRAKARRKLKCMSLRLAFLHKDRA